VYPILRLKPEEADAHAYVTRLEEAALRTAADFGVNAFRRHGKTGIWTPAGKLAAIGVRLRRWVTYHGLSLNVDPDLRAFDLIVPCGLRGEAVASLRGILGERTPAPAAVRERLAAHLAAVLRRPMELLPARSSRLDRALRGHLEAALPAQALEDDVHQHGKQGQPAHAGQQVAVHPRQRG
jgi:lipoate-protein ligase B